MSKTETLGAVLDDAAEVFRYMDDSRPQARAHEYIASRGVVRGVERDNTAMQSACQDMVRRAHAVGVREGQALGRVPEVAPRPGRWEVALLTMQALTLLAVAVSAAVA